MRIRGCQRGEHRDQIRISCAPHKEPGATAGLAREIHINGKLGALSPDQAKQVLAAGGK